MKLIESIKNLILGNILEFVSLFLQKKNKILVFSSIENAHYNQNSKYLFEFFLRVYGEQYQLYFLINDKNKLQNLNTNLENKFIDGRNIKSMWVAAKADAWICSDLSQPYYRVLKDRRKLVYHLGHGIPLKRIALLAESSNLIQKLHRRILCSSFTHILSYSEYYTKYMKKTFMNSNAQYIQLGQPRNDTLGKEKLDRGVLIKSLQLPSDALFVLYAPTWRSTKDTTIFPFQDLEPDELQFFLKEKNIFILFRRHPFRPNVDNNKFLSCDNVVELDCDDYPDISPYLYSFDGLITDYSSIYFDYLLTNKPIAFFPYDIAEYSEETGFTVEYNEITPGAKCYSKKDFFSYLDGLPNDDYVEAREKLIKLLNIKDNGNCLENAELIVELINGH